MTSRCGAQVRSGARDLLQNARELLARVLKDGHVDFLETKSALGTPGHLPQPHRHRLVSLTYSLSSSASGRKVVASRAQKVLQWAACAAEEEKSVAKVEPARSIPAAYATDQGLACLLVLPRDGHHSHRCCLHNCALSRGTAATRTVLGSHAHGELTQWTSVLPLERVAGTATCTQLPASVTELELA